MFTGIIEHTGKVKKRDEKSLSISAEKAFISHLKSGSSVAVNGACLTITSRKADMFSADIMPETWKRTILGSLKVGKIVNLELPLLVGSSLDGHFVQGHIDGTAKLEEIKLTSNSRLLTFSARSGVTKYLAEKGSVAINGISLTIISVKNSKFTVGIIPHTWDHTMLEEIKKGDVVNIEVDILAKYVEKLTMISKKHGKR